MKESGLWQRVRKGLMSTFPTCRLDRVENGIVDGMPDASLTVEGIDVWLELKYVAQWPSRASTKVLGDKGLRPGQINWLLRHARAGGKAWVVAGIGDETWLATGQSAREVNDWTRQDWHDKGIKVTNWRAVCTTEDSHVVMPP